MTASLIKTGVVLALFDMCSCASVPPARPLPALPPPVDLGTLLPPAPVPFSAGAHARRYPDMPIRQGQCGPGAPPGILVSPAVYAEQVAVDAQVVRLRREVEARDRLRVAERAGAQELERACRARVAELAAAIDRAERVSAWKALGILVGGIALGLVPGYLAGLFAATGR